MMVATGVDSVSSRSLLPSCLGHRYEVPILLTEIAPAEGLHQACEALQTLDAVIADVFQRIQNRVRRQETIGRRMKDEGKRNEQRKG